MQSAFVRSTSGAATAAEHCGNRTDGSCQDCPNKTKGKGQAPELLCAWSTKLSIIEMSPGPSCLADGYNHGSIAAWELWTNLMHSLFSGLGRLRAGTRACAPGFRLAIYTIRNYLAGGGSKLNHRSWARSKITSRCPRWICPHLGHDLRKTARKATTGKTAVRKTISIYLVVLPDFLAN